MSYGFNEDKSKFELDVQFSDINLNIQGKADAEHTHNAADITDGTLAVARGGTGQGSLQALRNAAGLGNTTGALPVANGGTGATAAANARTNLGATSRRNITANYSGNTGSNPDILVKTFTGTIGIPPSAGYADVGVGVSGYTPIAVSGFALKPTGSGGSMVVQLTHKLTSTSNVRIGTYHVSAWPSGGVTYTFEVTYIRTALINQ